MVKMLRVVRVMRFFKVLRMMVASIIGSMSTLFWSILMMAIMMYMFGLCFLQAAASYLQDAAINGLVDEEVDQGIILYLSGCGQAAISLYMAVTGGADWEAIAEPIKRS